MKAFWKRLQALAPHISIVCIGMMLTFLVIEIINPYVNFINHRYTRIILWVWAVSSLLSAILLIAAQRREFRRRERYRQKQRERRAAEERTE